MSSCQEASASEEDIFRIQVQKDGWMEREGERREEEKRETGRMEKKEEEERVVVRRRIERKGASVEKLLFSRAFEHQIDETFQLVARRQQVVDIIT